MTPWAAACQSPLAMEISRQEYLEWIAISFSRGFPPTQGRNLRCPLVADMFFTAEPPGKPISEYLLEPCLTWNLIEKKVTQILLKNNKVDSIQRDFHGVLRYGRERLNTRTIGDL